jgi:pSer/pThr/pTyr-binding forkhead associated (FHA) protein
MVLFKDFSLQHTVLNDLAFLKQFRRPFLLEKASDDGQNLFYLIDRGLSPLLLGRSPRADILIARDDISNRHAQLLPPKSQGERWSLLDLNSTNGTALNEAVVNPSELYKLSDRDALNFGGHIFHFLMSKTILSLVRANFRHLSSPVDPFPTGQTEVQTAKKLLHEETGFHRQDKLFVLCPDNPPIPLEIGQPVIIGRSEGQATIVLKNDDVSRAHAQLERRLTGVFLRDLGSTNGTFLGGLKVGMDFQEVFTKMVITIADFPIRVKLSAQEIKAVVLPSPAVTSKEPLPKRGERKTNLADRKVTKQHRITPEKHKVAPGQQLQPQMPVDPNKAQQNPEEFARQQEPPKPKPVVRDQTPSRPTKSLHEEVDSKAFSVLQRGINELQNAINVITQYSEESMDFQSMLDRLHTTMKDYLSNHERASLTVRCDGIYLGSQLVQQVLPDPYNLARNLNRKKFLQLTFHSGLKKKDLGDFIALFGRCSFAEEGLVTQLWSKNFRRISYQLDDPLSQEDCQDRVMGPVRAQLNRLLIEAPKQPQGDDLEQHYQQIDNIQEVSVAPRGTLVEHWGDFLRSDEGQIRLKFKDRYVDPFQKDLSGRTLDILAWLNQQEGMPRKQRDLTRAMATLILETLEAGHLEAALAMLNRASIDSPIPMSVCEQLGNPGNIEFFVNLLRQKLDPDDYDELSQAALMYLGHLGGVWIPGFCSIVARVKEPELIRIFGRALTKHSNRNLDAIVGLTLEQNIDWVGEALRVLGRGARKSKARHKLEQISEDDSQPKRAEMAQQIIQEIEGQAEPRGGPQ